jgi:hypothetical protein
MGGVVRAIGGAAKVIVPAINKVSDPFGISPIHNAMNDTLTGKSEAERAAAMAELDPGAKPVSVGYQGVTDDKGMLKDQFKLSGGDAYTKLAQERLATDTAAARNNASQGAAGAEANARTALATRGGLQGGVAARLAMQNQKNRMAAQQDVTAQQTRGQQDIASKQFDIGREAEQSNLAATRADQLARNQYNQANYAQQMQAWAAGKAGQAQLQGKAGKGDQGGLSGFTGKVLGK